MRQAAVIGLIAIVLGVLYWQFGGMAFAKRSPKPWSSRPSADACAATRGPGEPGRNGGTCSADADCKDGPGQKNGRCIPVSHGGGRLAPTPECTYDSCFTDAECGAGKLCECGHDAKANTPVHYCVDADCRTDAECGKGNFCSPSRSLCSRGDGAPHYYCHTMRDECMVDSDCPRPKKESYGPTDVQCQFSAATRRWVCVSQECPVG